MALKAIISTFDTSAEGWTVIGDPASFTFVASGGHPGGHMEWTDGAAGADSYWSASSVFLGDRKAFYGGQLAYDINESGNDYSGAPDVILKGGGLTITIAIGQPGQDWTHLSVALNAAAQWHLDTLSGAVATAAQIKQVLGDLTDFNIRAEYVSGSESGGLDNVSFTAAGADSIAWNLYETSGPEAPIGVYSTLTAGLAAASAGNVLALSNPADIPQHVAHATVNVDDLTIRGDATLDGLFVLGDGAQTFAIAGENTLNVTGNALKNTIHGSIGDNTLTGADNNDKLFGGNGRDKLIGGQGADQLDGGLGKDSFVYQSATESAGKTYDTVVHFDTSADKFSLTGVQVTGIDDQIDTGAASRDTFSGDFKSAIKAVGLGAHHAVLFTPDSGDLSGQLFLVIDANGQAGYQAGDMVIALNDATNLHLTTANFSTLI